MKLPTLEKFSHLEKRVTSPRKFHSRKYNCLVLMLLHQPLPRLSEVIVSVSILKYLHIFVVMEKLSEGSILVFSTVLFNFIAACPKLIQNLKDPSSNMHR